jgi:hypothetical protein
VDDPAMSGYTLSVDSVFRGYVTALWEGTARPSTELVFAAGTLMGASVNDGSGFGPLLNDISTDTEVAIATSDNPFVNLLVARTGTHEMGSYVGTRTFTVRYGSVGGNTSAALQNYNIGEVNVRFGLDPTYANFLNAEYPGADGESSDTHGHFVTITADFENDINPVPEPSTLSLMAVACALTCAWKRSRSAR